MGGVAHQGQACAGIVHGVLQAQGEGGPGTHVFDFPQAMLEGLRQGALDRGRPGGASFDQPHAHKADVPAVARLHLLHVLPRDDQQHLADVVSAGEYLERADEDRLLPDPFENLALFPAEALCLPRRGHDDGEFRHGPVSLSSAQALDTRPSGGSCQGQVISLLRHEAAADYIRRGRPVRTGRCGRVVVKLWTEVWPDSLQFPYNALMRLLSCPVLFGHLRPG